MNPGFDSCLRRREAMGTGSSDPPCKAVLRSWDARRARRVGAFGEERRKGKEAERGRGGRERGRRCRREREAGRGVGKAEERRGRKEVGGERGRDQNSIGVSADTAKAWPKNQPNKRKHLPRQQSHVACKAHQNCAGNKGSKVVQGNTMLSCRDDTTCTGTSG